LAKLNPSHNHQQMMEPYRVRVIEPIRQTTRPQRERLLCEADFNLYQIASDYVQIDLLTDSGTGAVSGNQLAAMMRGDESYAGSASYGRFASVIQEIFGFEYVIPTHQGRAAERILIECLTGPGSIVPSNTHFETTRANCLAFGVEPLDLPTSRFWDFEDPSEFKGNMDCAALEELLQGPDGSRAPFVFLTVTNNLCGDQPVSMANIREVRAIASRYKKSLYIDACRFAQNAWFIQAREQGYRERTIKSIVREMFSYADGCILSAKKDALAQIGGFLATRSPEVAGCAKERLLLSEGFITYGGMTGRDMEMIAVGIVEGTDDDYLRYRMETTEYLFSSLRRRSIPVLCPSGGHAAYVNAAGLLPHLAPDENPGQALAVELYAQSGIRSTRIVLTPAQGPARFRHVELLRLALPSRVYSTLHLDFVSDSLAAIADRASSVGGMHLVSAPRLLGGFLAKYERAPVADTSPASRGATSNISF
jgi:tryptophanase